LEGYYGALAYQLRSAGGWLPRRAADYGGGAPGRLAAGAASLLRPFFRLLSILFERLDLRYKNDRVGICKNYAVIAVKPQSELFRG
jgi:hypothetical protein